MNLHSNKTITVRPFLAQDRASVRRICYETSFLENPRAYTQDKDVVADVMTAYSTDFEPQACFVADYDGKVVGYLVGVKSLGRMNKVFYQEMLWKIICRAFKRGIFFKQEAWQFLASALSCFLKGEFHFPDFSRGYPASLHINITKECRGKKIGEKLIDEYLRFLRQHKIPGVLVSVMTESGKNFFVKNGFEVLFETRRSLFRYRLGRSVPHYLLGKKII